MTKQLIISGVIYFFTVFQAQGFPLHIGQKLPARVQMRVSTLTEDYSGIASLDNCSGSYVKFESSKPSDKAMILINGHCYESGMPGPGEVIHGVASDRAFMLLGKSGELGEVQAERIMYATMTGTDVLLYQLSQTYLQITSSLGAEPLTISSLHPERGTDISVVSGYWHKDYDCKIDDFVYSLHESTWTFTDSVRYLQPGCETIPGTSGSPILNRQTRAVIGINNTGNESGEKCTLNNPCEVDQQGNVSFAKGRSYGQQTYQIYSCLTEQNEIDLNKSGCLLAKGIN